MKLCHIVPSLEERHGGPSKSVMALSRALSERGSEVDLLATDPNASSAGTVSRRDERLRTCIYRRDWPQRLCPSRGLAKAAKEANADVYHHHSLWLRTLHYAHVAAQQAGAPLVVSPRGMLNTWAWHHHSLRKRLASWYIHPGALAAIAGWHATSKEEEQEIRSRGFRQPICVAPNGVSAPAADEQDNARHHWTSVCPDVEHRRIALFYSRFHAKKRVVELIDLWLEIAPREWLLLLVGIPEEYDIPTLQAYVANLGGSDRIQVFSGLGTPAPYVVASLFVLPSHSENFGLSIAEAMASGVPVVVTDSTPWSDVNTDQRGWCVGWSDYASSLREALSESPATLAERGSHAREWVLDEFSWTKAAERLSGFYSDLIRQRA